MKMFEKNSANTMAMSNSEYRLAQDGVRLFEPFMTKRKLTISPAELGQFIHGGNVPMTVLEEETKNKVEKFEIGCLLFMVEISPTSVSSSSSSSFSSVTSSATSSSASADGAATTPARPEKLCMVVWRGRGLYLNVLCDKEHRFIIRERLSDLGVEFPTAEAAAELRPKPKGAAAEVVTDTLKTGF
eukprot:FR734777.1.p1 GENE.FR734777.1~~FR734777.1.p1  ORF type:complete len:201 (+),score=33.58 FR734777.1:47-604(+)